MGVGENNIQLNSEGRIDFVVYEDDFSRGDEFNFSFDDDIGDLVDGITEQISGKIESQIDSLTSRLNDFTMGLSINNIGSDQEVHLSKEKKDKLDRKIAKAKIKIARNARTSAGKKRAYQRRFHSVKTSDPVSNDERKMVLAMLQNKTIDVDEAEKLLAALEDEDINLDPPSSD